MRDTDTYEVDKELKSISVFLADIPKNNILLIPEGYMDEVEEHILSQIFLTQIDHADMNVPLGYFENLESTFTYPEAKILNHAVGKKNIFNLSFARLIKYKVAAMILFFTCCLFVLNIYLNKETITDTAYEDPELYLEYLENNIDEFEIDFLADQGLIEESDISLVTYDEESLPVSNFDIFKESDINF